MRGALKFNLHSGLAPRAPECALTGHTPTRV